ncbi:MAG: HAMP domain-containing sensor histidine kinase, partial [Desulfovibrionaceae bacterium]|nr:HAMP domain-containing sensor histidine kinase [Desulfovibrionaceae bacterium]
LAPKDLDLDAAVQDLFRLLRFELKAKEVSPRLDIEAETVFADPDALRQALLNLLVNSLDALPDKGGELRLASRRGADAKGWPGTWLSVEDNGPGMAGEVRDRALEPFYTAKEKGTGLGLAIVQTIMRGHKGLVEIDSGPGQGARLKLFFPDPEAGDERPAA